MTFAPAGAMTPSAEFLFPQFCKSDRLISQSISESFLDFEITRVNCIWIPSRIYLDKIWG